MDSKFEIFQSNPIIAAVKNEEQLDRALQTDCAVIFFLFGTICSIPALVKKAKEGGKLAFVHLDLTTGLAGKEIAADYVSEYTLADGVISTRPQLIKYAKNLGLMTVLRVFLIDSLALDNVRKQQTSSGSDIVEIMPGIMPKIIKEVSETINVPIIAGGLIRDKEDVINALSAGATCISTTCESAWRDY